MWSFSAFVFFMVAWPTALASASASGESAGSCVAEEGPRAEQRGGGAVLLQLTSDSASAKARLTAKPASASVTESQEALQQNATTRSTTDEQLTKYAELKQSLVQSTESADIMRKMDQAIDSGVESSVTSASDVQSLDDVLKLQDALPAGASPEISLVETGATQSKAAKDKHSTAPAISLVETGASQSKPHRERRVESEKDDASDEDEEQQDEQDEEEDQDEAAGVNSARGRTLLEEEDGDAASDADASADDDSSDAASDDEDVEATGTRDEADQQDTDVESTDEVDPRAAEKARRQLSLLAITDLIEADRAPLNEDGYLDVASSRSNRRMERFVERLLSEMSLQIVDVGGLKGMVPFYSGQKATQSFDALQSELLSTARMSDGWLMKQKNLLLQKGQKARHENLLLQTDSTQHQASERPGNATHLSLLSAVRAVHKVPDLAIALFGSRTLLLLCTMGLVAALFCLDERKRTGKEGMDFVYENPLDMSPTPPPVKEDPALAASLKDLRGIRSSTSPLMDVRAGNVPQPGATR